MQQFNLPTKNTLLINSLSQLGASSRIASRRCSYWLPCASSTLFTSKSCQQQIVASRFSRASISSLSRRNFFFFFFWAFCLKINSRRDRTCDGGAARRDRPVRHKINTWRKWGAGRVRNRSRAHVGCEWRIINNKNWLLRTRACSSQSPRMT